MLRSRVYLQILCVAAVLSAIGMMTRSPPKTLRARRDFARAMSRLKDGDSKRRVLELLGPPGDIQTERVYESEGDDPHPQETWGYEEIWGYGTSGPGTMATLGSIVIDRKGQVEFARGGWGDPPPEGMFDEAELRHLLDVLNAVPSYDAGLRYNPLNVIRAVNLLQPLGKEKALAAIQEYLRVSAPFLDTGAGRDGIFLITRTLFDVPDDPGYFPTMEVGFDPPDDLKLLPRFPIVIVGEVPLIIAEPGPMKGMPEQPEQELPYLQAHGKLRSRPLVPSDSPFGALRAFTQSPRWIYGEYERDMLSEQLLRLLGTVYRLKPDQNDLLLPTGDDEKDESRRKEILAKASLLKIHWDNDLQQYTFLDATFLPYAPAKISFRPAGNETLFSAD
jgi:hypothetical protein